MSPFNHFLSPTDGIWFSGLSMIVGVYGFQDSGKTMLLEELVSALVRKGYSVASVKHTPHDKTIDCEGKDTWRHWKAGSDPVVFSSRTETSIIKHSGSKPEEIARLVMSEYRPDVLIIEGYKDGKYPKVAIGDVEPRKGTVMVNPSLKDLVTYVEDEVAVERVLEQLPELDCHKCGLDCRGLAKAIAEGRRRLEHCKELPGADVEIIVGGKRVPTGKFVSSIVDDTVRGMLSSLRGYEPGKDVEIRLKAKKKASKRRTSKRAR